MAEAGRGTVAPPVRLLLHGLQSPINVGSVLRVAETFGVPVDIWDAPGLFADPEKRRWIADFSCGAFQRGAFCLLDAPPPPSGGPGRRIATCLRENAVSLAEFALRGDDLVAIGNEYDGLPEAFIAGADCRLHIPMPPTFTPKPPSLHPIDPARRDADPSDGTPVLSAAMSAGILCYAAYAQQLARGIAPRALSRRGAMPRAAGRAGR